MARFYQDFADWWPLFSAPADYGEEAEVIGAELVATAQGPVERVLELGSGGGNTASHLKRRFAMTLSDRSSGMLEVSRKLNPECRHVLGDMRELRLGETFDGVLIHDAICYLTSEADLHRAIANAAAHVRSGGAVCLAPDDLADTFKPKTDCGGEDGEGRSLRYLSWTWDPDPDDTIYLTDYAFMLREGSGLPTVLHDRHEAGLFPRDTWLRLMRAAGLEPRAFLDPFDRELFLGRRS